MKKHGHEGDNMLAIKKDTANKNNENYTTAKNEVVIKAIMKSNKKHSKMMNILSR
jgi:hypothetical protein